MNTTSPDRPLHVLLGLTGSVATVKAVELIGKLRSSKVLSNGGEKDLVVQVIATKAALHFTTRENLESAVRGQNDSELLNIDGQLPNAGLLLDEHEWSSWNSLGDTVLHIAARNWADLLLIAPLDANSLSKISNGQCDNLLTSVVRAWEFNRNEHSNQAQIEKPILYAPAMNTAMWEHPVTSVSLDRLDSWGFQRIPPVAKKLACGDMGMGGMASADDIAHAVLNSLSKT